MYKSNNLLLLETDTFFCLLIHIKKSQNKSCHTLVILQIFPVVCHSIISALFILALLHVVLVDAPHVNLAYGIIVRSDSKLGLKHSIGPIGVSN